MIAVPNSPALPTVRRRRLGSALRRLRHGAGLSLDEAAGAMGWRAPKLSKIENAVLGVRPQDVAGLLAVYRTDDPETVGALEQLARDAARRGWWQTYSGVLKPSYADYIALESDAVRVRSWAPCVVPGLLQTPEYAREVITATNTSATPGQVDALVEVRRARQAVLDRPDGALGVWAVVHESVLHQRFARSPGVMAAQLRHLRDAADLPGVTVQVMPLSSPPHPGLAGPFSVVAFAPPMPDVVLVENLLGNVYLEDPQTAPAFAEAFERVVATALAPDDSLALIARLEEGAAP